MYEWYDGMIFIHLEKQNEKHSKKIKNHFLE